MHASVSSSFAPCAPLRTSLCSLATHAVNSSIRVTARSPEAAMRALVSSLARARCSLTSRACCCSAEPHCSATATTALLASCWTRSRAVSPGRGTGGRVGGGEGDRGGGVSCRSSSANRATEASAASILRTMSSRPFITASTPSATFRSTKQAIASRTSPAPAMPGPCASPSSGSRRRRRLRASRMSFGLLPSFTPRSSLRRPATSFLRRAISAATVPTPLSSGSGSLAFAARSLSEQRKSCSSLRTPSAPVETGGDSSCARNLGAGETTPPRRGAGTARRNPGDGVARGDPDIPFCPASLGSPWERSKKYRN
eukprot:Hpha_TRINITY_DN22592_c0_g1::TRINITY_DN22592_c0_g1_i1::g.185050::m.185050